MDASTPDPIAAATADAAGPMPLPLVGRAAFELGWRFALGALLTRIETESLDEALAAARLAAEAAGGDPGLRLDIRDAALVLELRRPDASRSGRAELERARAIRDALAAAGIALSPAGPRPVGLLEIAIDALDIPAVLPFWEAALGYVRDGDHALRDPEDREPAVWFQQMDEPRPQRNRIHLDLTLPEDVVDARIEAAFAAGGRLVSDSVSPAFVVLADAEGNELCLCTWRNREDEQGDPVPRPS